LGGLVDGIVLHQILQWHHLISSEGGHAPSTLSGLEDNTLADGLFHAATWLIVVFGIWLLWHRAPEWRWAASGRALVGWILVGWGLFNQIEGLIDHQLLGIHHVRDDLGGPLRWDIGFLVVSAALVVVGYLLATQTTAGATTGTARKPAG
jgi:uncharacterized membrane protein